MSESRVSILCTRRGRSARDSRRRVKRTWKGNLLGLNGCVGAAIWEAVDTPRSPGSRKQRGVRQREKLKFGKRAMAVSKRSKVQCAKSRAYGQDPAATDASKNGIARALKSLNWHHKPPMSRGRMA